MVKKRSPAKTKKSTKPLSKNISCNSYSILSAASFEIFSFKDALNKKLEPPKK